MHSPRLLQSGLLRSGNHACVWQTALFLFSTSMDIGKPSTLISLFPRGLVGRLGKILGSRALVVLHDQEGHPLLVTTHRGDQHLTIGLPAIIAHYEQAADLYCLQRVVVDREGMAAEFLAALASEGRTIVTVLRTDQYSGLESFREVSEFVPRLS